MNNKSDITEIITELEVLSKIHLTAEERDRIAADFELILEYMSILNECDTDGVEVNHRGDPITGGLREDKADESFLSSEYHRDYSGRTICVPEVIG